VAKLADQAVGRLFAATRQALSCIGGRCHGSCVVSSVRSATVVVLGFAQTRSATAESIGAVGVEFAGTEVCIVSSALACLQVSALSGAEYAGLRAKAVCLDFAQETAGAGLIIDGWPASNANTQNEQTE